MQDTQRALQETSYMSIWVTKSRDALEKRINELASFEEREAHLELRVIEAIEKDVKRLQDFMNNPVHCHRFGVHPFAKVDGGTALKNVHLLDCKPGAVKTVPDLKSVCSELVSKYPKLFENKCVPVPGDFPIFRDTMRIVYKYDEELAKTLVPFPANFHMGKSAHSGLWIHYYDYIIKPLYLYLHPRSVPIRPNCRFGRQTFYLNLLREAWALIRNETLANIEQHPNRKWTPAVQMMINFFEEYLGLALDIIPTFKANDKDSWHQILLRLEIMFARLGKHHYRDACMVFLSRLKYWQDTSHPMLREFFKMMPEFSEVVCELFFSVLSAHTKPHDTEEQVQRSAITVDLMKEEVASIHDVYKVRPLDCYTHNLTPSTGPKFFSLVEDAKSFLKTLFNKCLEEEEIPLEEAATFDKTTGLLSYQTKVFGLVPANLFPLPCSLPSCAVVCSSCEGLLDSSIKYKSRIRLKCGHMFHQLCLVPNLGSIRMKALYKEELKSLCGMYNLNNTGTKAVLLERLDESLTPAQKQLKVTSCQGCTRKDTSPSLRMFCHCCKKFIPPDQEFIRLPCSHVVHKLCKKSGSCKICSCLIQELTTEVCEKAKLTFTKEYVPKPGTSADDEQDSDDDDDDTADQDIRVSEKQEKVMHYFGELAVKAKHNKEQRGSLPKLRIDKVSE